MPKTKENLETGIIVVQKQRNAQASETQMVLAQNKGKLGNRKDCCLKIEDKFESGMVLSKTKQITKWG